jgi:hypothetical protein
VGEKNTFSCPVRTIPEAVEPVRSGGHGTPIREWSGASGRADRRSKATTATTPWHPGQTVPTNQAARRRPPKPQSRRRALRSPSASPSSYLSRVRTHARAAATTPLSSSLVPPACLPGLAPASHQSPHTGTNERAVACRRPITPKRRRLPDSMIAQLSSGSCSSVGWRQGAAERRRLYREKVAPFA